jgi:hypothetical protein
VALQVVVAAVLPPPQQLAEKMVESSECLTSHQQRSASCNVSRWPQPRACLRHKLILPVGSIVRQPGCHRTYMLTI